MSLTKKLGVAWPVWKFATKRLGPVGGLVAAVVAVVGYAYLGPWLAENHPKVASVFE